MNICIFSVGKLVVKKIVTFRPAFPFSVSLGILADYCLYGNVACFLPV